MYDVGNSAFALLVSTIIPIYFKNMATENGVSAADSTAYLSYAISIFTLIVATFVGVFQGAIQALSRSYYAKIIPKEKSSEYFGIFDIFGKGASFMGTMLMGISTQIFHTSKAGVIVIAAMFVIGFIVFKLQAGPVHRVKRAFINEDEDEYEDEYENDYEIGDMDFAEERF